MKAVISLLRPHQWLKNLFAFSPVFFDGRILDINYVWPTTIIFMAFCMAASGVYCFNDVHDVETDRIHPKKCHRPIASGAISKSAGISLAIIMALLAFCIVGFTSWPSHCIRLALLVVIACYVLMNIAYCLYLKQKPIVDVFVIAVGFVLRVFAGGLASGVSPSHWLILMTFLLALFLAFAKRRDDVVIFETTGKIARRNILRYNLSFMNQVISILASILMVCYILYTVSSEVEERFNSQYVYVSSIFVLAGIIRYLQVTIVDVLSGSPTKVVLNDHFMQVCIVGWIISFIIVIYSHTLI